MHYMYPSKSLRALAAFRELQQFQRAHRNARIAWIRESERVNRIQRSFDMGIPERLHGPAIPAFNYVNHIAVPCVLGAEFHVIRERVIRRRFALFGDVRMQRIHFAPPFLPLVPAI